MGHSPWGCQELDTTWQLNNIFHTYAFIFTLNLCILLAYFYRLEGKSDLLKSLYQVSGKLRYKAGMSDLNMQSVCASALMPHWIQRLYWVKVSSCPLD